MKTDIINNILSWTIFPDYFSDNRFIASALILLLSILTAFLLTFILEKILGRYARKKNIPWGNQLVASLHTPLFWTLILAGFLLTLNRLVFQGAINTFLHSLAATVLVILWSIFTLRFLRIVLLTLSEKSGKHSLVRPQTRPLFENIGIILTFIIAVYIIFRFWNIDMTAWMASAGILGIAVGFAAKDTLANLFSGVFILADGPYKIGDYIILDSSERGKVTHIGIRSTRLLTRDDVEITIPNAIMGNSRITNESGGPNEKCRITVPLGVAYGTDIDRVKEILTELAISEPSVCRDPEPRARFRSFGASSLDVDLLCWIENPEQRGRIIDILNTSIYKKLNEEGIEIPYSKHDIYIREMPDK